MYEGLRGNLNMFSHSKKALGLSAGTYIIYIHKAHEKWDVLLVRE